MTKDKAGESKAKTMRTMSVVGCRLLIAPN